MTSNVLFITNFTKVTKFSINVYKEIISTTSDLSTEGQFIATATAEKQPIVAATLLRTIQTAVAIPVDIQQRFAAEQVRLSALMEIPPERQTPEETRFIASAYTTAYEKAPVVLQPDDTHRAPYKISIMYATEKPENFSLTMFPILGQPTEVPSAGQIYRSYQKPFMVYMNFTSNSVKIVSWNKAQQITSIYHKNGDTWQPEGEGGEDINLQRVQEVFGAIEAEEPIPQRIAALIAHRGAKAA